MDTSRDISPNPDKLSILRDITLPPKERVRLVLKLDDGSFKSLARSLEVNYMHLYQVINGDRESFALKRRIAEHFGVEVGVLWPEAEAKAA